ncbi:MAG: sodium/proline symporter [Clostridiales bacterium]|nr:sodium/proline symporter [Clostridiales bacterium]
MNIWILLTIGAYLAMMILIGVYFSKKSKNNADYYLGGRTLGPLVTAMSAEASDMSSWLLMGLPGVALAAGLAEATWTAVGLAIGTYVNWLIVAKRIRIYSNRINAVTIPEFFSRRFGDKKGILSLVSAIIIVVFFIPYTASGFNACGTLFNSLSGGKIPYFTAMLVSAVVIIAYTALGGFLAASTTDLIHSIVMSIALIVVVLFGIQYSGGWDAVTANAHNLPSFLELTSTYDYKTGGTADYGLLTILSTLAWGLGYFGMPHILLRFMAIKDSNKLKTSRRIASVWVVISMGVAILIGVVGCATVTNGSIVLDPGDGQRVIIEIAKKISESGIGFALLAGIILAGILASTMSTADSQLLAASSSVSQDLLINVFKLKIDNKKQMIISRLSIILIAVIAIIWARKEDSVFKIVSFAWAGFGAAFGPVVLFALFWKRTTKWGALAGMISGGAMVFIWKYIIAAKLGGIFAIYELLPAFVFACIVIVIVSLATGTPNKEITDTYDEVRKAIKE